MGKLTDAVKDAFEIAKNGGTAVPREGWPGWILGPKYIPKVPQRDQPPPTAGSIAIEEEVIRRTKITRQQDIV